MQNVLGSEMTNPLEVVKHAYRQTQDGIVLSLVLHPNDVPSELAIAPLGTRYAMALVEITDEKPLDQTEEKTEGEKAVQQAGILCQEEGFQGWLYNRWVGTWHDGKWHDSDVIVGGTDSETAAEVVRGLCAVKSRAEFATNPEALARWKKLVGRYMEYQRHGL